MLVAPYVERYDRGEHVRLGGRSSATARSCGDAEGVCGSPSHRTLGAEAIGQPDLQYVQLPDDELVAILTGAAGFSPDLAALFVEFYQALSEGRLHSLEGRNERNTTPTEFEEFAAELPHAYAATE